MSVNNPSDSGGGADVAFANPPSMNEMDMGTMGAWAEIMAEEQVQSAPPSGRNDEGENREENVKEADEGTRKAPEQQSFAVQVTNLPVCTDEELFYHFGGDNVVRDVAFLPERCYAARVDLFTAEGLKSAKELDGQQFRGRVLRVYEIRDHKVRERPIPHDFPHRQYTNDAIPYNKDNSRQVIPEYSSEGKIMVEIQAKYSFKYKVYRSRGQSIAPRGIRQYYRRHDRPHMHFHQSAEIVLQKFQGFFFGKLRYDRYNSQTSLYSNDARNIDRSNRPYNTSNDYRNSTQCRGPPMGGTFPRNKYYNYFEEYNTVRYQQSQGYRGNGPYHQNAPYGGGYASRSRGGQSRGGYGAGRGNYYGSQELQRSDSYQDKPAPISFSRSRTESTAFDAERRRMELSRTSSRLSVSTEEVDAPAHRVVAKKLTNKDIFGEAKPVDTSEKLREIEAKQERERLLEQQRYKEEAEAARLAVAAEHPESTPPHHPPQQYGSHHGHVAHHAPHHQYHHAPSRPPVPPHASYGQYYPSHGVNQHSQQHHTNSAHFHQQQRYDGVGPGSYRIMRRESADATDASPPLDPVHAKVPLQIQSVKEQERTQDAPIESPPSAETGLSSPVRESAPDRRRLNEGNISGSETLPRPAAKQRVVYNSNTNKFIPLQKSATIGEIRDSAGPQRGRGGRGSRGGRGYNRGGIANDRRSSFSGVEKPTSTAPPSVAKPVAAEHEPAERKPSIDMKTDRPERKDYHGSHASLRSGRAGTLRKSRGGGNTYHKDRIPKESREDESWSGDKQPEAEPHREPPKPSEEPCERPLKEEKTSVAPVKKEAVKPTISTAAAPVATSSSTSVHDKKKEKKKTNKRESTKGGKTLNNNKFALLIDSED